MVTATKVTRYAVVGTGGRAVMFLDPIATAYREVTEIVGLCDVNPGRLAHHARRLESTFQYKPVPTFAASEFDRMVRETRPDIVVVCTVDGFHHQYIIRAMELGCDVITEKPITIDQPKLRAIFDAVRRTGRKVRVTFNYRWAPGPTLVRKLVSEGVVGEVLHVDMEYLLNTDHGADYFRRWHREKDKSGGLMVHKSTHHFDLVNWWIDAVPDTVFGFGRLAFYGRNNARKRGVEVRYDRYTGQDTLGDPFALDLEANPHMKSLYRDHEQHDGYHRDRNVFGDNITIEDTMSVLVKYRTGPVLNYSLNAFLPREGFHVSINGSKGRIEYQEAHASHIIAGQSDAEMAEQMKWESQCIVQPMFGEARKVEIPKVAGGHGGGDPLIQEQMFSPHPQREIYGRNAGHEQGAASAIIGIAANECFKTGLPVKISEFLPELGEAKHLHQLI